ncbi:hypothetical protein IV102_37295 [bacterium]|nr:hypothetical protein [bacterium]
MELVLVLLAACLFVCYCSSRSLWRMAKGSRRWIDLAEVILSLPAAYMLFQALSRGGNDAGYAGGVYFTFLFVVVGLPVSVIMSVVWLANSNQKPPA